MSYDSIGIVLLIGLCISLFFMIKITFSSRSKEGTFTDYGNSKIANGANNANSGKRVDEVFIYLEEKGIELNYLGSKFEYEQV